MVPFDVVTDRNDMVCYSGGVISHTHCSACISFVKALEHKVKFWKLGIRIFLHKIKQKNSNLKNRKQSWKKRFKPVACL